MVSQNVKLGLVMSVTLALSGGALFLSERARIESKRNPVIVSGSVIGDSISSRTDSGVGYIFPGTNLVGVESRSSILYSFSIYTSGNEVKTFTATNPEEAMTLDTLIDKGDKITLKLIDPLHKRSYYSSNLSGISLSEIYGVNGITFK